ncbi:CopG family transcriptional regulator [Leptolyngbya sp. NK1-12]|nr:CopG family transcriptional regulator [Leptolyngbya sp. NK1-12]
MMAKVRKQIYLDARQDTLLKRIAQQTGVSEAEIIRQALDQHLSAVHAPSPNLAAWQAEKAFIAQHKQRPALPGGRDWQRADLYER